MGTRSVEADQGITPTIAHAPTRIVHGIDSPKDGFEKVPIPATRFLTQNSGPPGVLSFTKVAFRGPESAGGVLKRRSNPPPCGRNALSASSGDAKTRPPKWSKYHENWYM